jgi:hypothetical protein
VEDGEDRGLATDPRAIVGEPQHRGGGLAQERRVHDPLMDGGDRAEFVREREGE